jgi:predicted phage replisome organizer
MRERKYIKFRVDMLSDTKSKIIDTKPERDMIHYIWMALVLLAGKVNMCGELYLSKNIPYTIETLALEFNRNIEQVKLALDVFIELEMVEIAEGNIYRVKNFAKHQNIKLREKIEATDRDKEKNINKKEVPVKESLKNEIHGKNQKELENKTNQSPKESTKINEIGNLEVIYKDIRKIEDKESNHKNNNSKDMIPILLEAKKNKRVNKTKKKDTTINFEEIEKNEMVCFYDDERPLCKGERVTKSWSF